LIERFRAHPGSERGEGETRGEGGESKMAASRARTGMGESAEYHAQEAERLLNGKLGIITNYVKAQVHATLAVYYATKQSAER
jgi:hypothetical protein